MPRSTKLTSYGPEYEQLLLRYASAVPSAGVDYTLQFETPNAAESMRKKLYAYFQALRVDATRQDLLGIADSLSIRCAGSALVLFPVEDSWDAQALRKALGLEKGFQELGGPGIVAPRTSQTSMQERLRELRENKSKK